MTGDELRAAPLWVRGAAALIRHAPAGRYRMAHGLRRAAGAPFLMRLPADLGGYGFHCDMRDSIAREVCFTGRYEPQETLIASQLVRPGMTVADVGANWGYFTLAAAHWVGSGGRIVAFEPERRLFAMLAANVSRNRLAQVAVRPCAVAAGAERIGLHAFDEAGGNWGTSRATRATGADQACDAVALDDELDRLGVAQVDLLKVDVEGGELEVLEGMTRGLSAGRYRHILLECHPEALAQQGSSVSACLAPLLAAGYRAYSIDHGADAHRRAAGASIRPGELLRPFDPRADAGPWPHFLLSHGGCVELP